MTKATDNLGDPNTVYRVKFRAVNDLDKYSDFSQELIFALGSLPTTPDAPVKIIAESKSDAIMISWNEITNDSLAIIGYRLYADSGLKDELKLVYDGKNKAANTQFLFTSAVIDDVPLSNLLFYRFQVTSLNFNGESQRSDIALLQTCTAPSQIPLPQVTAISTTYVAVSWFEP